MRTAVITDGYYQPKLQLVEVCREGICGTGKQHKPGVRTAVIADGYYQPKLQLVEVRRKGICGTGIGEKDDQI